MYLYVRNDTLHGLAEDTKDELRCISSFSQAATKTTGFPAPPDDSHKKL